jgi:hypothetical protein
LGDWQPEPELLAEAERVGLSPTELERRIKRLRASVLPPRRGVPDRGAYVMTLLEQWAKWERENLEAAQRRAGLGPRLSSWGGGTTWAPSVKMRRFAEDFGLPLDSMAERYVRSGEAERRGGGEAADREFIRKLCIAKRDKQQAAA